jgi:hypothetical protein
MPAASAARAITPSSASISRTRWPLPRPPIAGLHDISPIVAKRCVTSAVSAPQRAAAVAASHPAWPPPMTTTSNFILCPSYSSAARPYPALWATFSRREKEAAPLGPPLRPGEGWVRDLCTEPSAIRPIYHHALSLRRWPVSRETRTIASYFPTQRRAKISPSTSSTPIRPTIRSIAKAPRRRSSAINSGSAASGASAAASAWRAS